MRSVTCGTANVHHLSTFASWKPRRRGRPRRPACTFEKDLRIPGNVIPDLLQSVCGRLASFPHRLVPSTIAVLRWPSIIGFIVPLLELNPSFLLPGQILLGPLQPAITACWPLPNSVKENPRILTSGARHKRSPPTVHGAQHTPIGGFTVSVQHLTGGFELATQGPCYLPSPTLAPPGLEQKLEPFSRPFNSKR